VDLKRFLLISILFLGFLSPFLAKADLTFNSGVIIHLSNSIITIGETIEFTHFIIEDDRLYFSSTAYLDGLENVALTLNDLDLNLGIISFTANGTYIDYVLRWSKPEPYLTELEGSITSLSLNGFEEDSLVFSVGGNSGTTSTAQVYCGSLGEPSSVTGASTWSYNPITEVATASGTHASDIVFTFLWLEEEPPTPSGDGALFWSPQVNFGFGSKLISFNDWTYLDSFNINAVNINFTNLRLVRSPSLAQIGFNVQNGNLTIKESGSNQLTLETLGGTGTTTTVYVYCFALGEPLSVEGATSYSYANEVLTFTVLHPPSPPSNVIIIWGAGEFIDQYFPLMLFIVGFVCFFLPLGIIFWRRPDPATCIKLIMVSFIGFAVLMFSGSA